jgi:hypothetical protein
MNQLTLRVVKKNKNNNKIQTGVAAMITTKNTHFPNVSTIHFFFATSPFTNVSKTNTLVMIFSNMAKCHVTNC